MRADRHIAVVSVGGTIASASHVGCEGVAPQLDAADLIVSTGVMPDGIAVEAVRLSRVPSPSARLWDLLALRDEIARNITNGASGIVVTHGTSTMEESAFAMSLLWGGDEPIVFTGAMRNPTLAGADGPANLRAAIIAAASPALHGLGTVVVFDGEIHSPRYLRKVHANSTAPFLSREIGPLGWLSEDQCRIAARPVGRVHIGVQSGAKIPPIALLETPYGDDGRLLDVVASLYSGLVVAGMGPGHVPVEWAVRLCDLAASKLPVVIASRTGAGETYSHSYDFPGGDIDLARGGVVAAGTLDARKARIALSLLLAAGYAGDAWRSPFQRIALPSEGFERF